MHKNGILSVTTWHKAAGRQKHFVQNPETLKLAWRNVLICEFRYKRSKINSTQHTNLVNSNSQINPLNIKRHWYRER